MEFLTKLYQLLRHLGDDARWTDLISYVGVGKLYVVLCAIVFAETGLVVTPFLPGDSLLFALGAIGSRDVGINLPLITGLLIVAAILGDAVNYWIGYKLGPAVFNRGGGGGADPNVAQPPSGQVEYGVEPRKRTIGDRLLNREHLLKAQAFYEKYGGKTIILARFVPVVRTFAPFVAGVGKMNYLRFALYNVIGAIAWVLICVGAGVLFGQSEFVKKRFELVIVMIVLISVLPMAIEVYRARQEGKRKQTGLDVVEATTIGKNEP